MIFSYRSFDRESRPSEHPVPVLYELLSACWQVDLTACGSQNPFVARSESIQFFWLFQALAELRDTEGRYYWFWHLRGNISISQLVAPMPPGLSWSSPTCLCTPEIAAPSPPGGRWLQYRWMHARGQPAGKS